jgi:hypothetical protein
MGITIMTRTRLFKSVVFHAIVAVIGVVAWYSVCLPIPEVAAVVRPLSIEEQRKIEALQLDAAKKAHDAAAKEGGVSAGTVDVVKPKPR